MWFLIPVAIPSPLRRNCSGETPAGIQGTGHCSVPVRGLTSSNHMRCRLGDNVFPNDAPHPGRMLWGVIPMAGRRRRPILTLPPSSSSSFSASNIFSEHLPLSRSPNLPAGRITRGPLTNNQHRPIASPLAQSDGVRDCHSSNKQALWSPFPPMELGERGRRGDVSLSTADHGPNNLARFLLD